MAKGRRKSKQAERQRQLQQLEKQQQKTARARQENNGRKGNGDRDRQRPRRRTREEEHDWEEDDEDVEIRPRSRTRARKKARAKRINWLEPLPINQPGTFLHSEPDRFPNIKRLHRAALAPLNLIQRPWKEEIAPMVAVFLFAMALYIITTPRQVTLEDDGLFLMNLHHFGVGHPPGYPLYTLLGAPFYHLMPEFLTPAFRGHIFSGFVGALACVAMYSIVAMLVRFRVCAMVAAMAYAASECFWSQAIIAEVYTLNAALYFCVFAMCMRYASKVGASDQRHIILYALIGLVFGMGMSNHWPLLGLGSIGMAMIVISQWRNIINPKAVGLGIIALGIGLLPYVWMIIQSHRDIPINFYGPIRSAQEAWFYFTRSGYSGVDTQAGVGLPEKIAFSEFYLNEWARQITWAGLAIAFVGFVAMLRTAVYCWLAVCLVVVWFMAGPLLIFMLDFQTEFVWFSAFRVYHLLSYGATVIFFGYGLGWLAEVAYKKLHNLNTTRLATSGVGAAIVVGSAALHWSQNDRSGYTWARDYAIFKLLAVDRGAHVFSFDDLDLPVTYLNYVERVRPDLTVYNDQGLVFGNRIYSPFTNQQQRTDAIANFVEGIHPTPVFYHTHRADMFKSQARGSDFMGLWRRVNRDDASDRVILSDSFRLWLANSVSGDETIKDRWTRQQAEGSIATLVSSVHWAISSGFALTEEWREVIAQARRHNELVHLLLLWNEINAPDFSAEQGIEEIAWIDSLFERSDDLIFDNNNWADVLMLKANIYMRHPELAEGDLGTAVADSLKLALTYEFKFNIFRYLADILRGQQKQGEAISVLKEHFSVLSTAPNEFRELYNLMLKEQTQGRLLRSVVRLPGDSRPADPNAVTTPATVDGTGATLDAAPSSVISPIAPAKN